jgi:hypothetical protein
MAEYGHLAIDITGGRVEIQSPINGQITASFTDS